MGMTRARMLLVVAVVLFGGCSVAQAEQRADSESRSDEAKRLDPDRPHFPEASTTVQTLRTGRIESNGVLPRRRVCGSA